MEEDFEILAVAVEVARADRGVQVQLDLKLDQFFHPAPAGAKPIQVRT